MTTEINYDQPTKSDAEVSISQIFGSAVGWNSGNVYPVTVDQLKHDLGLIKPE